MPQFIYAIKALLFEICKKYLHLSIQVNAVAQCGQLPTL